MIYEVIEKFQSQPVSLRQVFSEDSDGENIIGAPKMQNDFCGAINLYIFSIASHYFSSNFAKVVTLNLFPLFLHRFFTLVLGFFSLLLVIQLSLF